MVSFPMTYAELANPGILRQPVYEPGKPIEEVARELGLEAAGIIKLASNENPHGSSPKAVAAAERALRGEGRLYPDGGYFALRQKLAERYGLGLEQFIVGNGSNEILELLGHAFVRPGVECVMGAPAFIVYKLVTRLFGGAPVEAPLVNMRHDLAKLAAAVTPRTRLVFLPSPNNPTGTANGEQEIMDFVRALPEHVIFVFDEAYAEYVEGAPDLRPLIREGRKVICLRTFSKIYGLASLRVGFGYAGAELIAVLQRARQPFNVGGVAAAAAGAALDDGEFVARCARENRAGLAQLGGGLRRAGVEFVPSEANFLLMKVGDGAAIFEALQRRGIIVRPMKPYGLPEWLRVTVGTHEQNERLLASLREVMSR